MPTAVHFRDPMLLHWLWEGAAMPTYKFKLADDDAGVEDDTGISLPSAEFAHDYACAVVRELMRCREQRTRHWRLSVYQEDGGKAFEIPFARLDRTLDHLNPQLRARVEHVAGQIRLLRDVWCAATVTMREAKSLVARSRGKPYLAADRGQKIIRDAIPTF